MAKAIPLALAFALVVGVGCGGGDEGPGYLPKPGEAAPLNADSIGSAVSESQAVADEERAAAAQDLPRSKGKSKR